MDLHSLQTPGTRVGSYDSYDVRCAVMKRDGNVVQACSRVHGGDEFNIKHSIPDLRSEVRYSVILPAAYTLLAHLGASPSGKIAN